jgi:hypothetical protein
MKKIAFAAAAAVLVASASGAFAEGEKEKRSPGKGPERFIEALDTNKDSKVDASEFVAGAAARATARFEAIDTEGKGVITKEQFIKAAEAEASKFFERMDRDGDGALTKDDRPPRGKHGHKEAKAPGEATEPAEASGSSGEAAPAE